MTEEICSNGVKLIWDETLKIGDLITTYHKGYWKLVNITPRKGSPPMFHYTKSFKPDGTPIAGKATMECDASYCRNAKGVIADELSKLNRQIAALSKIQASL